MPAPAQRQLAYVLHRRRYRETSAIVEYLTREHGRVDGVVRGVHGRGARGHRVEPFDLLAIDWRGRGQLLTVTHTEQVHGRVLAGDSLFAGMYLNELLKRTLRHEDPVPRIFAEYDAALAALEAGGDIEPPLRIFERTLLGELGYGVALDVDSASGEPLEPDAVYRFDGEGFARASGGGQERGLRATGEMLAAVAAGDYGRDDVRRFAKRLFRAALRPHLGDAPLRTRSLFRGRSATR